MSPRVTVKCDPCVGTPPSSQQFANAGIDWATDPNGKSNVFFTRLHVRYTREQFPQDLQFQITPNKERFQCRYVVHNPARGGFECEEGQEYLKDLVNRRSIEVDELAALTGWENKRYQRYIHELDKHLITEVIGEDEEQNTIPLIPKSPTNWLLPLLLGTIVCVAGIGWRLRPSLQY